MLEHWIQLSFFEASVPLFGGITQDLADFAPLAEAIFYLLIKKKSESPITELDLFMQLSYKQSIEIAEEEIINNVLNYNKFDQSFQE